MWHSWQVVPSDIDGEARYWSQTTSSLIPGWTATWWQETQNSDFEIWSSLKTPRWILLPRSPGPVATR